MSQELPDVQAGFRKGRGIRNQIVNICWIIEKARELQKSIYFCFIDYAKAFGCGKFFKRGNTRPPPEKFACRQRKNNKMHLQKKRDVFILSTALGQEATVTTGLGQ